MVASPPLQPTSPVRAARAQAGRSLPAKSVVASDMLDMLVRAPVASRRQVMSKLPDREVHFLLAESSREFGTAFGLWQDDPDGFVETVLGESIWSKQRDILRAIVHYKRVAVPAGFGVGKTWIAGRLVAWAGSVHPPGSMIIPTTATRLRQVRYQLWPHIRAAITRAGLPGTVDITQWKIPDRTGTEVAVAYGFTAPPNDEAAMQGVHGCPKLLLVVDEAGGISKIIGNGTNNLLTGDAHMLAIGNPAMDDPGTWFEELCTEGEDPDEPTTTTIRIATTDSPAITGEPTPVCKACYPNFDGHTIAGGNPSHLPDQEWLDRTLRDYGEPTHPYIVAKVFAQFPKDAGMKAIPASWVEGAVHSEDPVGLGYVRLCDLGLDDETAEHTVKQGAFVRLGVDVAADGGDELAIYRAVGDAVEQVHVSAGSVNADSMVVVGKILDQIDRAQRLAKAIRSPRPVRVKIDATGLGWGVLGVLEQLAAGEAVRDPATGKMLRPGGRHYAEIVGCVASEAPETDDEAADMRPANKRAETWITGRYWMRPDPRTGVGQLRLRVDKKCWTQLSLPGYRENRSGKVLIESKAAMRKRGVQSPDRADAALLAVYEPFEIATRRRFGMLTDDSDLDGEELGTVPLRG